MKNCYYILFIVFIYSCSSTKDRYINIRETQKNIHIQKQKRVPTASKDLPYPFVHINGFKNHELKDYNFTLNGKKLSVKELRFNAVYSSFYTKKVMFDNFGKWDKIISIKKTRHPLLVWQNIKLDKNQEKEYTIIARSFEDTTADKNVLKRKDEEFSIYASVIVLDADFNDCFSNTKDKENIINYFSEGIKNLTNSELFYNTYWSLVNRRK